MYTSIWIYNHQRHLQLYVTNDELMLGCIKVRFVFDNTTTCITQQVEFLGQWTLRARRVYCVYDGLLNN